MVAQRYEGVDHCYQIPAAGAEIEILVTRERCLDLEAGFVSVLTCNRKPLIRDIEASDIPAGTCEEERVATLSHGDVQCRARAKALHGLLQKRIGAVVEKSVIGAVHRIEPEPHTLRTSEDSF